MTPDQIWKAILNGFGIVRNEGIVYRFYLPTLEIEQEAQVYALSSINWEELPDEKLLEECIREILTEEEIKFYEEFPQERVEKKTLIGLSTTESRKRLLESQLKTLESRFEMISKLRRNIYKFSIENIRYSIELDYYFYRGVRFADNTPLWENIEDFEDSYLVDSIRLQESYSNFLNELYDEKSIRSVAKISSYRVKLKSWEESNIPICRDVTTTTEPLTNLLYWCHLYNNVITNSLEDVPDDVVQDDDRFDEFLEHMNKKHKTGTRGEESSSKSGSLVSIPIIGQ